MTPFAVIRHGPTDWNAIGRVQGRSDVALSTDGRAVVAGWSAPPDLCGFEWVSSPLLRAAETARILFGKKVPQDDRLVEMDWAEWEGRSLSGLRAELGDLMAAWEARGLDFRAPGGESPREVQARLSALLAEVASAGRPVVAVSHKGVIRALYALATGWEMTDKPPDELRDDCAHLFSLSPGGAPVVHRLNIALTAGAAP